MQKSRFYEKKRHKPKEVILKEKTLPLLEKDIIKKVKRKPVRAKRILERIKKQDNVDWNSKGQFLQDKQPIPSSNIADLLNSALDQRDSKIPGWKEFDSVVKWKTL